MGVTTKKDGTAAALLHPLDFIGRLCALQPPQRFHMVCYLGVLAGHAKARAEIVPGPRPQIGAQLALPGAVGPKEPKPVAPSRHPWA